MLYIPSITIVIIGGDSSYVSTGGLGLREGPSPTSALASVRFEKFE